MRPHYCSLSISDPASGPGLRRRVQYGGDPWRMAAPVARLRSSAACWPILTNLHARHLFSEVLFLFSFGSGSRDTMRVRCMIHLDHADLRRRACTGRQGIVFRPKTLPLCRPSASLQRFPLFADLPNKEQLVLDWLHVFPLTQTRYEHPFWPRATRRPELLPSARVVFLDTVQSSSSTQIKILMIL
jgi:hypothetical protein